MSSYIRIQIGGEQINLGPLDRSVAEETAAILKGDARFEGCTEINGEPSGRRIIINRARIDFIEVQHG